MDSYDLLGVFTWVLTAASVALALLFLRQEKEGSAGSAVILKLCASGTVAVLAAVSYTMSVASYAIRSDVYFMSLMLRTLGLFLCVPADGLLQYIRTDSRRYLAGILCFLGAQILFAASLLVMDLLSGWAVTLLAAAAALCSLWFVMRLQTWSPGREKSPIMIYTVLLALVAGRALASLLSDPSAAALSMFLGSALFVGSDLMLGMWNYHNGGVRLRGASHAAYFGATILIALSVSPMLDVPLR